MTENTILVVDADQETEDKIVSTLEAEGYLVFTASGKNVNAGMAKKLSFSLIYLKPTSSTIEGFETCRSIHKIEKFKDVPIILLATLQGRVDPRYTTYYGIVDYLKMPLNPDELLEMTKKMLSSSSEALQTPEESVEVVEQEAAAVEEPAGFQEYSLNTDEQEIFETEQTAEADIGINKEEVVIANDGPDIKEEPTVAYEKPDIKEKTAAGDDTYEIGQAGGDYSYGAEQEKEEEKHQEQQVEGIRDKETKGKPKSSIITILLLAGLALVAISAGFFAYRMYLSPQATEKPAAVDTPSVQPAEDISAPSQEPEKIEETVVEPAPSETTKEVPVTVQEIEPKGKPVHSVQLGAFRSESSALELANTYKDKGYEAFAHKGITKGNEVIYRVLIGKFESRKEAFQFSREIRNKENIKTAVFSE